MTGYINYVRSKRGSRVGIQKLKTYNHEVVHFNLQFLAIKRISYKKGISLYKIRIYFLSQRESAVMSCLAKSNLK